MYCVETKKIIKATNLGLMVLSCITFLSMGIYNLFFTSIGGLIEFIVGILLIPIFPSIFKKHIIWPGEKIIYNNGYWKKEIQWSDIKIYELKPKYKAKSISHLKQLILYNIKNKKLLKIDIYKENGELLLNAIQDMKTIKIKE